MAFPDTILPLQVEIKAGTWTDITSYVRGEQQVRISRGRQDEGGNTTPTRCSFTLDNNDSRFTPGNPTGPYYGLIGRNTPCRVSVNTGSVALDLTGGNTDSSETADTASLDITGDLDVRLDASFANWLWPSGVGSTATVEMIGKLQVTTQKSWFLGTRAGLLYFEWSADGTNSLSASSTVAPVIPGSGRLAVRVTLDVDNGASGNTVRFYTAENLDAPWTQLGDPVTQSGTTSIFSSTSPVRIGNATNVAFRQPIGKVHAAEIRNGLWGTVVAQPRFDQQTSGATSFADSAGRTWTLDGSASITNRKTRFYGEISAWPRRWETGGRDITVAVEASGIMRRMSQGVSPIRSAMYRELTNPARSGIVAYWPMEDGATATRLGSALDGLPSMTVASTGVSPAGYSDWDASEPIPVFSTGTARGPVPSYTASSYAFHRFFAHVPSGGVASTGRMHTFTTTGTARTWSVYINTSGNLDLRAYDADGAQILATGFFAFGINDRPVHIGVELTQDGADIDYTIIVVYIDTSTLTASSALTNSGTLAANTFGVVTEIRLNQDGILNGTAIGHVAVAGENDAYSGTIKAMIAYNGEDAGSRLHRLGEEEALPTYAVLAGDMEMGSQRPVTLLELLRECEAADGGILREAREFLGFSYRDRLSLYSQLFAMDVDYEGDDGLVAPLEPTDDDQQVRNDRTVQRAGGASARATLDTGPMSTANPEDGGIGRYDDSTTINLYDDEQPPHVANWLLHLGTWDGTRYPTVKVLLQAAPHLIEDTVLFDSGTRFRITNPPPWEPPDLGYIDLMVQGYTEVMDQHRWEFEFNCSPAGPWDVAWAGDGTTASSAREFAWTDTTGSELVEDLTSTETDVDVLTTDGPVWSPNVKDTPFDWRVSGEVMTVTAPHSLINTNPFFGVNVSDWSVENSTLTRSTTYVHPHPRATASMLITPVGGAAFVGAQAGITAVDSITPGASYTVGYWAFSVNGWADIRPTITWYTSGAVFISTVSATATAISASVWTYFEATFVAPATASRAQGRVRMGSTPAASDTLYVWAARGPVRVKSSALYDTFARSVTDSWGISDSGHTWQLTGTASEYDITGTYGTQTNPTAAIAHIARITAPSADTDFYVDLATAATATGAALVSGPVSRCTGNSNFYTIRVAFNTSGTITMILQKRVASVDTTLASYTAPYTHAAGTFYRVRLQTIGTSIKGRFWLAANLEPNVWHMTATDSSLTTADGVGVRCFRDTGNTNANAEFRFQNFDLFNPQTYTVTRSQNGVVKAQSDGASVALATPAYTAL